MDDRRRSTNSQGVRPPTGRRFARNLDWNLLKVFHEIADAGGINEAARRTARKQPTLSMALKRLEERLGMRLCRRGPGGFELSHEGRQIADACAELFRIAAGIPSRVADHARELRGRVRVQLISNLVDPRIDEALRAFYEAHPLVEIFVSVTTWDVVKRSVLRNEVEIGIAPAHHKDSELRYELLFVETHRPYCGRGHPLFGHILDDPAELAREAFILTGADEPDELTRFRMRYGLGRHMAGLSEHLEEARRLAVLGVGICFLPEAFVAEDVAEGRLHPLLPPSPEPSTEIFVITNPRAPAHSARERLLDEFRRRLPPTA